MLGSFSDTLIPEDQPGRRVVPWMRAIQADGTLVGFVMVAEATTTNPHPFLYRRLLVGRWHQGRGIGRRAVEELGGPARAEGHRRLVVSWRPGPGSPERFYLGLGFVPTGEDGRGQRWPRSTSSRF